MREQDIPIDIHISKLQEWLVSRRVVTKQWHSTIPEIRNKINKAIQDMPSNERLIQLLSGAYINYFHCTEIVQILKETEADSKNVFGMYTSQRMKDWQDVIRAYEHDNIFLAEASQILARNVQYEIPGVKKQIQKFEQLNEEADKKVHDLHKSENIIRNEHLQLCQQLGISGKSVKAELVQKLQELPEILAKITTLIPVLDKSINLYLEFTGQQEYLPVVRHVSKNGITTVFEYLYSEKPLSIELPKIQYHIDDNAAEDSKVDFSIDTDNDEINFDDVELVTGEINFDIDDGADVLNDDVILEVDNLQESGIVVEIEGQAGSIAKGDEAYSILDSPYYRESLIDELYELEAFLKMRLFELNTTNNSTAISISIMERYSNHDEESVTEMLQNVEIVLSHLTNQLVQHLFQLQHSPKYVVTINEKLEQKLRSIEKIKNNIETYKVSSKDYAEKAINLKPQLDKVINQTKILQKDIEREISKRYKNRVVNLMGNIFA